HVLARADRTLNRAAGVGRPLSRALGGRVAVLVAYTTLFRSGDGVGVGAEAGGGAGVAVCGVGLDGGGADLEVEEAGVGVRDDVLDQKGRRLKSSGERAGYVVIRAERQMKRGAGGGRALARAL